MADGYVSIVLDMNVDDAEKELKKLDNEMLKLEKEKAVKSHLLESVKSQAEEVTKRLEEAKARAAEIEDSFTGGNLKGEFKTMDEWNAARNKQAEIIASIESEQKRLTAEEEKYTRAIEAANRELEITRTLGGEAHAALEAERQRHTVEGLNQELEKLKQRKKELSAITDTFGFIGNLQYGREQFAAYKTELSEVNQRIQETKEELKELKRSEEDAGRGAEDAGSFLDKFSKRINGLVKRVFIFSLITTAFRSMRTWLSKAVKSNDEAAAAMARLKGAMLTLAQPLLQVIIPAFTWLVNLLTAIIGRLATLISALFGKTAKQSAKAAKGLSDEADALGDVGNAADEAAGSLAGFDEINTISTETAGGAGGGGAGGVGDLAPDFGWMDGITDKMKKIADLVLLIGAGFALWKLSSSLPGILGTIAEKAGLLLILIGGLLLYWDGIKDAWNNGLDWTNLIEIIGGVAAAVFALYQLFGPVAAGIALVVMSVVGLVTAFRDAMANGWNLQNTILALVSILGIGIGLFMATGNAIWIVIAAVAALLLGITVMTGNGEELIQHFKTIIDGFKTFFVKIFEGDLPGAMEGLKNVGKGVANALLTILESAVNLVIRGLNWLISKINMISFDIPDWLGGGHFGLNFQPLQEWKAPRLAQGAVVPPNREFMAVLGDNKKETEIVSPLSTMKEALLQALQESGAVGGRPAEIKIYLDKRVLARAMVGEINDMTIEAGRSILKV